MSYWRALILTHRRLALVVLALAFLLKAAIPSGFMLSSSKDKVLTVEICSAGTGIVKTMQIFVPGSDGHGGEKQGAGGGDCAFSGLSMAGIAASDSFLLGLVFAFTLILGLAPTRHRVARRSPCVLPPLRGPPIASA